ncbi:hypothetical protein IV45_GL000269 [Limosilactobacillus secaliphilus]|uniref:Tagaturonate/fructuronate epimerase n=2 Tax=Limosilactobacillus secaliphilus TaxID=396268 RepID=A0A0R2IAG5_9LACO|nr:hypothetical protein IV45_GL000269 [Limosilactobacillus secaliphilus]
MQYLLKEDSTMDLDKLLKNVQKILADVDNDAKFDNLSNKEIYVPSIQVQGRNVYFNLHHVNEKGYTEKTLVVYEDKLSIGDFVADERLDHGQRALIVAQQTEPNYKALAKRFSWMKPTSRRDYKYSFGLGDRLGNASNAHLRFLKGKHIFPVIAQQSIRELTLMHRTNTDVFLDAAWSVFDEGFTYGWGAEGDHVKTEYEVDYAVKVGCRTIVLDCTEVINNKAVTLSDEELDKQFNALDDDQKKYFNDTYLNKTFTVGAHNDAEVHFTKHDVEESVLTFYGAVLFATKIYHKFVVPYDLDFEISMDETPYSTTNPNHYFFANELHRRGITPTTMAPRFYGEFQKAIDYIGDLDKFEKDFSLHEKIAEHFGYKLSVHSGSDKLSVYPIIGRLAKAHGWHVKTAGTHWLEACRVIAHKDPQLFVDMYRYAYNNLDDVKDFYVFNAQTDGNAPKPETVTPDHCQFVLSDDDGRQVMHTMFGSLMNAQHNYHYVFRDKFWDILKKNQKLYDKFLNIHLAEHIDLLTGKYATKQEALDALEPKTDIAKEY